MASIGSLGYAKVSDADWATRLKNNEINASREQQAREQADRLGRSYYTWYGIDGASGTATKNADGSWGGGSRNSSNASANANSAYASAKDLAQQQLEHSKDLMGTASGYRMKEADQKYGWERNIQGDKLASDERINTYNTDADKWKTKYTTDASERMQAAGFKQETSMANLNSTLKMRENQQTYGFQLNLQRDNNAAKKDMQAAGFKQERDVLEQKNQMQQESMRTSALRAARAFRGQIPMNV